MIERLKQLAEIVSGWGDNREVLLSVSKEELLEMSEATDHRSSHNFDFIRGLGGNINTYKYLNVVFHLKIK